VTANGVLDTPEYLELNTDYGASTGIAALPGMTAGLQFTEIDLDYDNDITYCEQSVFDQAAPITTDSLDVGATLLNAYTAPPEFDTATVSWTEDTTAGQGADAVLVDVDFDREYSADGSGDDTVETDWEWQMIAPRGTNAAVALPVLPTDIYDYNAEADDDVEVEGLDSFKLPGGYDMIRALAFTETGPIAGNLDGRAVWESLPRKRIVGVGVGVGILQQRYQSLIQLQRRKVGNALRPNALTTRVVHH
jgi:hypothetical protein